MTAFGRSTDDGGKTTMLVVHEVDGSWTIHGLGAPGVTLSQVDMVALAEVDPGACPVSAPRHEGAVRLAVLDDSLAEGYRYGGYLALCGTVVATSDLPCSLCPDGCDCDPTYCPACVRAAASWNAEADRALGAVVHSHDTWSVHVR